MSYRVPGAWSHILGARYQVLYVRLIGLLGIEEQLLGQRYWAEGVAVAVGRLCAHQFSHLAAVKELALSEQDGKAAARTQHSPRTTLGVQYLAVCNTSLHIHRTVIQYLVPGIQQYFERKYKDYSYINTKSKRYLHFRAKWYLSLTSI